MKTLSSFAGPLILLCAACATFPVPNDQRAASQAAYRGAQEAGADAQPQAKLALQLAQDESAKADQLVTQGRNQEAAALYDRSRADAELAVGLARESQLEAEAKTAADKVAALRTSP